MYFTGGCLSSQAVVSLSCNAVSLFYRLQLWFNLSFIVLFKHSDSKSCNSRKSKHLIIILYRANDLDWLQPKSVSRHQLQMKTIVATITWNWYQVIVRWRWAELRMQAGLTKWKCENLFCRFCMIVLSIFTPRICFIALNLSYSGHSHVGLLSLLRTMIRTKLGHKIQRAYTGSVAMVNLLFLFTGWSKTKKVFFSFPQTELFHDRSEWLDN